MFNNFLDVLTDLNERKKLSLLVNHVSTSVYEYIAECSTYTEAMKVLKDMYEKPTSVVFARHKLLTCCQKDGETLDQFMNSLKQLSKECNFQAVDAVKNRDDCVRDAFITGLSSNFIRQRLPENKDLSLQVAYDQARSLEQAQTQADTYRSSHRSTIPLNAASVEDSSASELSCSYDVTEECAIENLNAVKIKKCYYCGGKMHQYRSLCPAKEAICHNCNVKGHFSRV